MFFKREVKMKKIFWTIAFLFVLLACNKSPVTVENPINNKPIIDSVTVVFDLLPVIPTANITCWAYDPDGDSLSYKWKATAGEFMGSGRSVTYVIAPCCDGIANKITVEVNDPYGAKATYTFPIRAPKP